MTKEVESIIEFVDTVKIDIDSITLLSEEEYINSKKYIPPVNFWWWLRSPGSRQYNALFVGFDGSLFNDYVHYDRVCVRPALIISNLKSSNLKFGNKFKFAEKTWTVISDNIALCDSDIGFCLFREDHNANDANNYEKSDIKKFLDNWARENGIIC